MFLKRKKPEVSLHILAFQNIPSIFYFFLTKIYICPLLMDMSAKNVSLFWTASLMICKIWQNSAKVSATI